MTLENIKIGEYDITEVLNKIIDFVLTLLKFEFPELSEIIK